MPLQPNAHMLIGQPKRYLGRKFDKDSKEYVVADPYECEDGSEEAERCKLFVSRGEAMPADAATAKACGVSFAQGVKSKAKAKSGEVAA